MYLSSHGFLEAEENGDMENGEEQIFGEIMGIVGDRMGILDLNLMFFFCHSLQQQFGDFGGGKLVHFPVLLPLPVGLPSLGPARGGDLWEMPAGMLQETPQNIGDLFFSHDFACRMVEN